MPTKRSRPKKTEKINKLLAKRNNPGKSNASTNPFRKAPGKDDGKGTHFRTRAAIKMLNLRRAKPDL